ncbi:hypothetical protein CDV36_016127, partial [Fusarium kuroshium]
MDYNVFSRETDMMPGLASAHHFQAYSSSSMHCDCDNQDFEDRVDPSPQDSIYACHLRDLRDLRAANMQRFFQEHPASWLELQSSAMPSSTYDSPYGYPSVVSSIAPGAQFRHDPPISHQQSLATSDNDPYVDSTQGPSTPPNNAILSPHISPQDSHCPQLVLAGLADPGAGSDSPMSTPFYDDNPNPFASLNTPTLGVNTKIQTFTAYPELQDADTEDAQADDGSGIDLPSRADDEGEEYKPTCRTKSSRVPKTTPRRGHPRRSSSGTNASKTKIYKPSPSSRTPTARKPPSSTAFHTEMCPYCPHGFTDQATLQKHINSLHKRPFTCVFHFAG